MHHIQKLIGNQKGSVAPIFAVCLVALAGVAGSALDYVKTIGIEEKLQYATDAAALFAAGQSAAGEEDRIRSAIKMFRANTVDLPEARVVQPDVSLSGDTVTVSVSADIPTTLLKVLRISSLAVKARSVATMGGDTGQRACILQLNAADPWGINMGSSSGIETNCGIFVNNEGTEAIKLGSGQITSKFTAVMGQWRERSDFVYNPVPVKVTRPMADPFSGLAKPTFGGCSFNGMRVRDGDPLTLNPGVYCGGLEISTSRLVTFNPGVYIIKDGAFKMGSSSRTQGNGVFIYLTGSNAVLDWGSGAQVSFIAAGAGPWKGMLIWGDGEQSSPHVMGSHTSSVLQGAVYSPRTKVIIGCSGKVGASSDWTVWVVRSLDVGSSATLVVTSNFEGSTTPLPDAAARGLTHKSQLARLMN